MIPKLSTVVGVADDKLRKVINNLVEVVNTLAGHQGNPTDQAALKGDLRGAGVITLRGDEVRAPAGGSTQANVNVSAYRQGTPGQIQNTPFKNDVKGDDLALLENAVGGFSKASSALGNLNRVDTGDSFPTRYLYSGRSFYRTDRKILYTYENSVWVPLTSFGPITLYVDSTGYDGDAFNSGGGAQNLQAAWDEIPAVYLGDVTIRLLTGHVDTGGAALLGKNAGGPYIIYILGAYHYDTTWTVKTAFTPTANAMNTGVKFQTNGATRPQEGDLVEFTTGALAGFFTSFREDDGTDSHTSSIRAWNESGSHAALTGALAGDEFRKVVFDASIAYSTSANAWTVYDKNIVIRYLELTGSTSAAPINGLSGSSYDTFAVRYQNSGTGTRMGIRGGAFHRMYIFDGATMANGNNGFGASVLYGAPVTFDSPLFIGSSAGASLSEGGIRTIDSGYLNVRGGSFVRTTRGMTLQNQSTQKAGSFYTFGRMHFQSVGTGIYSEAGSWGQIGTSTPAGALAGATTYSNAYFDAGCTTDTNQTTAWGVPFL